MPKIEILAVSNGLILTLIKIQKNSNYCLGFQIIKACFNCMYSLGEFIIYYFLNDPGSVGIRWRVLR